jgi:hypothetical protein
LATGEAVITVTAQTSQGGVNTQQKKVVFSKIFAGSEFE